QLSQSKQPLVPERVFVAGSDGQNGHSGSLRQGLVGTLLSPLVAQKTGFQLSGGAGQSRLKDPAERLTREAPTTMSEGSSSPAMIAAEANERKEGNGALAQTKH